MRLTARSRRVTELARSWRHGGGLSQRAMAGGLALCLALLCATAGGLGLGPADAGASPLLAGRPVPPGQLHAIRTAALSCPALSPPRLAAQLMAASGFNAHSTHAGGGSGVAGLTAAQWRQWAPAPGVARSDVTANIVALAHDVCDLAGWVRVAHVPGDVWCLALAAFHSGLQAVIAARGVPASAAGYVATVAAYANWYALLRAFGGAGVPAPAPATHQATRPAPASPTAGPTPTATPSSTPSTTPTAAPASTPAATPSTAPAASSAGGWQLTWSDEFSGPAGSPPDPGKWSYDTGGNGWGNSELEDYTTSTANAALNGNGQLVITAREGDPSGSSCWYGACRYTSARLLTLGHFSQAYGQISARIKLPSGQGIWPSFWALGDNFASVGWPQSGQMDIMTSLSNPPATVSAGLIGPSYNVWARDTLSSGTFADAYHTFTADWYPDHVSFFVDGQLYDTQYQAQAGASWVFDHPFFLILNLAVGGTEPGNPDASTTFPQQMLVDWVRVYQAAP